MLRAAVVLAGAVLYSLLVLTTGLVLLASPLAWMLKEKGEIEASSGALLGSKKTV